ncbi:hypothetical protein JG688_00014127 [Phytophthora aleatoria]|uniref:Uncharacterized protein n=1 Tax=Phytophthora aleatoria TaxID=2496075 RepID=A0A8J5J0W0_9STRA|nr:hypothetical protein JG688_00014127 [Phytophthora aleatoria]
MTLASANVVRHPRRIILERIAPFASHGFLKTLNAVLTREVDGTFSCQLYEALQKTSSWDLYDQIKLYGFDSAEISEQLRHLEYVKEQTLKVRRNAREAIRERLLAARAEKIARMYYPYYFDYTDHPALFAHFNTFALNKIPQPDREKIQILLDKNMDAQDALLNRRCKHVTYLKTFKRYPDSAEALKDLEVFLGDANDGMYLCRMCARPLICEHEIELRTEMAAVRDDPNTSHDNAYMVQRRIVNKYALVNHRETGDKTTESLYTYYCKYCGGELGKSIDVVQAGRLAWASGAREISDNERMLFTFIASHVRTYARQTTIPISLRTVTALLFDLAKPILLKVLRREKAVDSPQMRYFCLVYTLAGLLALNVSKIKSSKSILNTTGETASSQLKREFVAAMKIVHSNASFKRIGASLEKIKAALVVAFRDMNSALSHETVFLQTTSARERLEYDIRSSPLASYATSMFERDVGTRKAKTTDVLQVLGVNLDALFVRKKSERTKPGALFKDMYVPEFVRTNGSDDRTRYSFESYADIAEVARNPPRLLSNLQQRTSKEDKESDDTIRRKAFMTEFENRKRVMARLRNAIPLLDVPAENSREHDFSLTVEQVAFCLNKNKSVRIHHWNPTRARNGKLKFVCRYCGLNILDAAKDNNSIIQKSLHEQMRKASFFECYTLACPVKRAHVFERGSCVQCGATELQLKEQNDAYYKKYSSTYRNRQDDIATKMLSTMRDIVDLPLVDNTTTTQPVELSTTVDPVQLESLVSSLAKLFSIPELDMIMKEADDLPQVESYVRIFYSHYLYVKNLSIDTLPHPDPQFSAFVRQKYFDGTSPKKEAGALPMLPAYPTSTNPLALLTRLLQIVYDFSTNGNEADKALLKVLLAKMAIQRSRHEHFNRRKLRTVMNTVAEELEEDRRELEGEEDDSSKSIHEDSDNEPDGLNMIDACDIESDLEDNVDGSLD